MANICVAVQKKMLVRQGVNNQNLGTYLKI